MSRSSSAGPLAHARAEDSGRRRRRVLKALDELAGEGQVISVSAVARLAGVHRSLIYRHADLHAAVAARAAEPPDTPSGPRVSRHSLLADLANLTERNTRLSHYVALLEKRLSEALGEQTWRASGLGVAVDVDTLQPRNAQLEEELAELRNQLVERDEDLEAARATNRELMAQLNTGHRHW